MKTTSTPLEVGFYRPTEHFQSIKEHVAVMKPDGGLVAITGPSDFREPAAFTESLAEATVYAAAWEALALVQEAARDMANPLSVDAQALLDRLPVKMYSTWSSVLPNERMMQFRNDALDLIRDRISTG